MSENPFSEQGRVGILLDKSEYAVIPSGKTTVTVILRNQGLDDDQFALAIGGIPAAWVSSTQPVLSLSPGEEKGTDLIIQAPGLGETETGEFQLTIRATSQQHPEQYSEVKVMLTISMEAAPSKVVIDLDSTQFSVAPGSSTTFTIRIKNNGLTPETLRLFVDGIPTGWVSTPSPVTELEAGEEKEIPVTISPSRTSESRAGRHPIAIHLISQDNPDQVTIQEAILTVGTFSEFQSEVKPSPPIEALQNAQIVVMNEGNFNESFKINWQSDEDVLAFELWQKEGEEVVFNEVQEHTLKADPGEQEITHFRSGLRKRPLVGGNKTYSFQVQVGSSSGDVQTHTSQVADRGIIPIWVIPLVLVLCVTLTCLAVFIYNWLQDDPPPVIEDYSWTNVQEAGVLKVATSADYPPFAYHNADYVIDGFDPALIRDIGEKLGVQVEISDYAFEGLGATLNVGQVDLTIAAISITPEREEQFDFSNIYYVGKDGILARADSGISSISSIAEIAGKRVGVQQFTVYESWAQDILVGGGIITADQLFVYSKPEHALDDLRHKRLDLVVMDLQPATLALGDGDLALVGQDLNQQRLAIAFPKGANALRAKVNEALLTLQNEGRVNQLAEIYLGLSPDDIIPPPTPQPTPEITETPLPTATQDPTPEGCVDAMDFVEDLNFDDEDLTNFPQVNPGETFQKGWRIKNTGTCIWNSTYFIKFMRGTQMEGQPTSIQGAVEPDQTYDMYVDLVAPDTAGEYVGYWQMHNTENEAFGQTIWVAIEVRDPDPETPTATVTPEATPTPTEEPPPEPTSTPEPTETGEPEPTEEPGADLRGKTWILEGFLADLEDEDLTDPLPDVDGEMRFEEERNLEGNSGCNTFSGRYVTDGTAIVFQDILGTNILCNEPEGIMDQEAAFLELLNRAEEYRINEDGKLEVLREVIENDQPVMKVILLFGE